MDHQPPIFEEPPKTSRTPLFWIALLAPAVLALGSFLLGRASAGLGVAIGLGAAVVGLVSSIYCGIWLAVHFCKPGIGRFLAALGLVVVINAVNLFIVLAGCAANFNLH